MRVFVSFQQKYKSHLLANKSFLFKNTNTNKNTNRWLCRLFKNICEFSCSIIGILISIRKTLWSKTLNILLYRSFCHQCYDDPFSFLLCIREVFFSTSSLSHIDNRIETFPFVQLSRNTFLRFMFLQCYYLVRLYDCKRDGKCTDVPQKYW